VVELTLNTLASLVAALRVWNEVPSLRPFNAVCRAASAELTWPSAEICVFAVLVWESIWSCSGFFLAATSWLTRPFTSSPEPTPAAVSGPVEEEVEEVVIAMVGRISL